MPPTPHEAKLLTISQAKERMDADDCEADEERLLLRAKIGDLTHANGGVAPSDGRDAVCAAPTATVKASQSASHQRASRPRIGDGPANGIHR